MGGIAYISAYANGEYHTFLYKLQDWPTEHLEHYLREWRIKSPPMKFLQWIWSESRIKVTKDLLEARRNPRGSVAERIAEILA